MKKIAYIIPGFMQQTHMPGYQHCATELRKIGYIVKPISITWKYTVLSDWINEVQHQMKHDANDNVLLLGFSFGAIIACCISTNMPVQTQILCSLSPYFAEDLPKIPTKWATIIGKRRINNFKELKFIEVFNNQPKDTHIIAGTLEGKEIYHRATEANTFIPTSTLTMVEQCFHDLGQKEYMEAITYVINSLITRS